MTPPSAPPRSISSEPSRFSYLGFQAIIDTHAHARTTPSILHKLLTSTPTASYTTKDETGHFYRAQLIHYDLPRARDKNTAKMRLLEAVGFDGKRRLGVPGRVEKIRKGMEAEWEKMYGEGKGSVEIVEGSSAAGPVIAAKKTATPKPRAPKTTPAIKSSNSTPPAYVTTITSITMTTTTRLADPASLALDPSKKKKTNPKATQTIKKIAHPSLITIKPKAPASKRHPKPSSKSSKSTEEEVIVVSPERSPARARTVETAKRSFPAWPETGGVDADGDVRMDSPGAEEENGNRTVVYDRPGAGLGIAGNSTFGYPTSARIDQSFQQAYRPGQGQTSVASPSQPFFINSPLESLSSLFTSLPPSTSKSSSEPVASFPIADKSLQGILNSAWNNNAVVILAGALGGTAVTLGGIQLYRQFWRRIRNADYVTSGMLARKRWVRGVVTTVGDGDNFRLFHTPGPFFSFPFKLRQIPTLPKELKDETLHIRIAGVDAPECAHFGRPSQPHSKESLDWLQALLLTPSPKKMAVQLLRKDQYGRIVGVPYIRRLFLPNIPLPIEMLKSGMAVVYESGGAEYGSWGVEGMKKVEAEAKAAKRGLWALPSTTFEHPADYKKRYKVGEDVGAKGADAASIGNALTGRASGGLLAGALRWWRAEV